MTESMKFTNPSPAPATCTLACASREAGAENNLKLARAIVVEVADRGADQHVKIKVGTLLALALGLEGVMKAMASLEADRDSKIKALSEWEVFGVEILEQKFKCLPVVNMKPEEKRKRIAAGIDTLTQRLDERSEDLSVAADKLNSWRTHARHILDRFFCTYPTSDTNDANLRVLLTASIEHAHNKNKQLNKDYDAMRNSADASDQLRKAAELERDDVINLNRNAAEEINELRRRNEHLDQTVVDLVRQRDKNGQQANQLACEVNDLKKQRERLTHLADDYRRDLDAAARRCVALTSDAQALIKQRDDVVTRLGNARLQIADLKRRFGESQENALLQRVTLLESENRELATKLADAGLEIANYKQLVEDLKAGTAVDRDTVKRQEDTIERLYGQLNEWHDWATDVICSPSSLGGESQRTAITSAMRKRKERIESLEATVKAITAQRDAWVLWAKSYTDTVDVVYTNEQLLSLVKAKVKVSTVEIEGPSEHTFKGTLKVTKLKGDVVACGEPVKEYVLPVARGWCMMSDGDMMIKNAVVASGSIPASKVTFSDEMKAAIREVIEKELAPVYGSIADILSKMRR